MAAKAFCVDYKCPVLNKVASVDAILAATIDSQARIVTLEQCDDLQKIDPFIKLLVRTNNGRFTTAVQNVRWYCGLIENHYNLVQSSERVVSQFIKEDFLDKEHMRQLNVDWIRDISIPSEKACG